MAERYQDRPFPSDDYGRGGDQHGKADSDPLAELARLIGQTDPFAAQSRPPVQSYQDHDYRQLDDQQDYAEQAPSPPSWMRRANVQPQPAPAPEPDYPVTVSPVHPLHRYAAKSAAPEPVVYQPQAYQDTYQDQAHQDQAHQEQAYQQHGQAYQEQSYQEPYAQPDPSRYDDALYGRLETGEQDYQREPAYPDDPYADQSDYPEDEVEEPKKQRGGMMTVAAILALAVLGTGAAFAYKTYIGSPRSGEPPIIKADNTPTKIVPAPTDSAAKVPDRMVSGDGTEKIVPREEAPVDVNAKAGGPRVVFPPLNQNANPPSVASVSPSTVPPPSAGPSPSNGTLPNNSPRAIRTVAVKGDQTDSAVPQSAAAKPAPAAPKPVAAPVAPAAPRNPPTSANASANQPMSLAPQSSPSAEPPQRIAATNPTQIAPTSSGGGYIVQVSSQQSEDSAAASYRVLQSKYGSVLGSRSPVIKRVDLTDKGKGVVYRAFAGPYGSAEEATQACNNLKSAGLSACFVQRN
ncbi:MULTISPECIES: SPOR domain-containing protein [Bradyrhizobium]|uniref:Sporulation related domain-containing protein n=2 Tax=Bradyrhizobium yuanmingense TaxID=108015 RepID=A0A1C3W6P4_9BRAD|nr:MULTISPECIES: SPOR domain-containing protein [Bradyrhizobium]MCA1384645.1 SPOR domain-containing protein [Bradyrhizobium sp. BRP05]MCA1421375.1 SPOR domain-containing protein [Bradyrhizobium sp. BRP23]TWI27454.1 sporulation related protein [Bradyrhizobium yuanmingense]SCB35531.1 Sporulation related domain-containing protein [Bradyrhizobium yuanmingense]